MGNQVGRCALPWVSASGCRDSWRGPWRSSADRKAAAAPLSLMAPNQRLTKPERSLVPPIVCHFLSLYSIPR